MDLTGGMKAEMRQRVSSYSKLLQELVDKKIKNKIKIGPWTVSGTEVMWSL